MSVALYQLSNKFGVKLRSDVEKMSHLKSLFF